MAECAHNQFNIPEILIMPTATTYYKDGSALIDSELRMDMIRLAIEDAGTGSYMKPSYVDLDRGGITYTCDTIRDLKSIYDKIYFIIGTDSLMYIEKWNDADVFLRQCSLLVALREGASQEDITAQQEFLENEFGADIEYLDSKIMPVSSSDIRDRIKKGKSVEKMLPESVLEYIIEHNLYV